jgi:hypothetical protein
VHHSDLKSNIGDRLRMLANFPRNTRGAFLENDKSKAKRADLEFADRFFGRCLNSAARLGIRFGDLQPSTVDAIAKCVASMTAESINRLDAGNFVAALDRMGWAGKGYATHSPEAAGYAALKAAAKGTHDSDHISKESEASDTIHASITPEETTTPPPPP